MTFSRYGSVFAWHMEPSRVRLIAGRMVFVQTSFRFRLVSALGVSGRAWSKRVRRAVSPSAWKVIPGSWRPVFEGLIRLAYRLPSEIRNFCWRIRWLFSRKYWGLEFGSHSVTFRDGRQIPNTRTACRIRGTEELILRYPWCNISETKIFREGFDLGEECARDSLCIGSTTPWDEACLESLSERVVKLMKRRSIRPEHGLDS